MPRCLVAIGSNLGDRRQLVADGIARLRAQPRVGAVVASSLYETLPVGGPPGQATFVNAAVAFDTDLSAEELLAILRTIEEQLGRKRHERWAARTIDLDLLLFGTVVIDTPDLVVPHPRMAFRRFVLAPAAEVAGEMIHPTTAWTVRQLLARLDSTPLYVALMGLAKGSTTSLARRLAQRCAGRFLGDPAEISRDSGPSDPPSREFQRPIEFLDARGSLLGLVDRVNRRELVVSDFYLDQSLAYARVGLDARAEQEVAERCQAMRDRVASPRLLVVLVPPPATLAKGSQDRGLVEAFLDLAKRPRIAPALILDPREPERALDEVAAAVDAMR